MQFNTNAKYQLNIEIVKQKTKFSNLKGRLRGFLQNAINAT